MALGYRGNKDRAPAAAVRRNPKAQPAPPPDLRPEPVVKLDLAAQKNPELPHDIVVRVVQSFACWTPASEIADHLLRDLGVRVATHQLYRYDPDRPAGRDLPEELKNLHAEAREEYREAVGDVPISNRVYRMRELQRMYERATDEVHGSDKFALQCLEQAAKECGGAYERSIQVEHVGKGGSALPPAIQISFADPRQLFTQQAEVIEMTPLPLLSGDSDGGA